MVLNLRKYFVSAQYLENKFIEFHQNICININKIYAGIVTVTHDFSHIRTRVMTLDLRQSFVSDQFLENKLTEF